MCCKMGKYTVCRCICPSFSPKTLQAGAVKGLICRCLWRIMGLSGWTSHHLFCVVCSHLKLVTTHTWENDWVLGKLGVHENMPNLHSKFDCYSDKLLGTFTPGTVSGLCLGWMWDSVFTPGYPRIDGLCSLERLSRALHIIQGHFRSTKTLEVGHLRWRVPAHFLLQNSQTFQTYFSLQNSGTC